MKSIILATFALSTFLFIACNSGSYGKNSSAPDNEMAQMEKGVPHNETAHMTADEAHEEHAILGVKGSCEMCKERIEKAATSVEGVSLASWDMKKQELHMHFDPATTNLEAISKMIAAAGHDTDKDKATQAVYDALPSCCKYRK